VDELPRAARENDTWEGHDGESEISLFKKV
jgi:hypothetical protein